LTFEILAIVIYLEFDFLNIVIYEFNKKSGDSDTDRSFKLCPYFTGALQLSASGKTASPSA